MAGSIKWFKYTTDTGAEFGISMDESNGEAISNTDAAGADAGLLALPRNIKPRYVVYRSTDGRYTRKIPVTSRTATVATLPATISVDVEGALNQTLALAFFQGERVVRIVRGDDTGLNDGDDT